MSYANGTTHYNFPQIIGSDRPTFVDFNEAFRTLDQNLFELGGDEESIDTRLTTLETTVGTQGTTLVSVETKANEADAKADTNAAAIINLDTEKQNKADNTLTTTDKTIVGAINELDSNLSELQQVLTGTLAVGVNIIQPTGSFTLTNCYIVKVDYLSQGQWRDAEIVGVQPWIDTTQGIDIYGSTTMPSDVVGLPFRCILRKL